MLVVGFAADAEVKDFGVVCIVEVGSDLFLAIFFFLLDDVVVFEGWMLYAVFNFDSILLMRLRRFPILSNNFRL